MTPSHNPRGFSLLYVIAMVTLLSIAATSLVGTTAMRYHHSQLSRDRLQALQCAQAGLLWARARIEAGEIPEGLASLPLGEAGAAQITAAATPDGLRIVALGTAFRGGEPQAGRRLEVLWHPARQQP